MNVVRLIVTHGSIALFIASATGVSRFYRFPQHEESIMVLGSGIILGLLFRMGAKVLPALFVGLLACHILIGYKMLVSIWIASSMLISGWLAVTYMRRLIDNDLVGQPVHNFLHFYIAAMLISPVSNALLDIPLVWLIDRMDLIEDIRIFILSYTLGGAIGSLVFAPAIILYGRKLHLRYAYADYSELKTEKNLWLMTVGLLVMLTLFLGERYFFAGLLDAELLLYPMIVWSALRLGVVFTNIAVAIVSYTVFTFHFFGLAGTAGEMNIPQVMGMLLLVITLAVLGQLVAATTLERRKQTALLEQAANVDTVTGLANVRSLYKCLAEIAHAGQDQAGKCLLGYVSICNFGALVQGYGIDSRYALYRQFGGFLQLETDSDIELYRVSGPAFALLIEEKHKDQAITVMRGLAEQVKHFQFVWQNRPFHINAVFSLVPAISLPGEKHGPLEHASALADRAYDQGNIGVVIASHKDQNISQRQVRADWLAKITEAMAKDRFSLVAQPIVPVNKSNEQQTLLHFEILLRLQEPGGSIELPDEFIPHAEAFNLMPNIDRWVVKRALQWLSSPTVDLEKIGICSINLSGQSIADLKFCTDIEQLLLKYQVPGQKICFEITETAAIANMYRASSFVLQLQDLGCSVALDDFGSGMSSFEYLKKLSVNVLKIDGAFIRNMTHSKTDYVIVDAVWRVAQSLQLTTVAEYVESEEILTFLSEMGVNYAQGYYIGKPVSLDELIGKA